MFFKAVIFLVVASSLAQAQRACSSGYTCTPIRDCPEARNLARLVKNTEDEDQRQDYLSQIRDLLCGERKDYSVCCETATLAEAPVVAQGSKDSGSPCETGPVLGNFKQLTYHPVSGKVVAKDSKTLLICNFIYDGQGPDAFLIVGNRQAADVPNSRDAIPILPPPKSSSPSIKKKFYFKDKDIPILREFRGQTLELSVPEGETTDSLKWISLFCRDYDIDFGHAVLNQDVPKRS